MKKKKNNSVIILIFFLSTSLLLNNENQDVDLQKYTVTQINNNLSYCNRTLIMDYINIIKKNDLKSISGYYLDCLNFKITKRNPKLDCYDVEWYEFIDSLIYSGRGEKINKSYVIKKKPILRFEDKNGSIFSRPDSIVIQRLDSIKMCSNYIPSANFYLFLYLDYSLFYKSIFFDKIQHKYSNIHNDYLVLDSLGRVKEVFWRNKDCFLYNLLAYPFSYISRKTLFKDKLSEMKIFYDNNSIIVANDWDIFDVKKNSTEITDLIIDEPHYAITYYKFDEQNQIIDILNYTFDKNSAIDHELINSFQDALFMMSMPEMKANIKQIYKIKLQNNLYHKVYSYNYSNQPIDSLEYVYEKW